jgi:hypothetical protein
MNPGARAEIDQLLAVNFEFFGQCVNTNRQAQPLKTPKKPAQPLCSSPELL